MTELPEEVRGRLAEGAFLLVDKPRGPTSHQVTAWVRDLLGVPTAGHAGTLDPNVSGLLWVGVGPALKLIPLVLDFPKRYIGVVELHGRVDPAALDRVLGEFTGPIFQTPPVRSAVKRERRVRTIHRLSRLDLDGSEVVLDVVADSGTYIRTLAVDVGEALGLGAHLTELRRTGTGPFLEGESLPLGRWTDLVADARRGNAARLLEGLRPLRQVWQEFPILRLRPSAAAAVAHGASLARGGIASVSRRFAPGAHVVLVAPDDSLVAYGTARVGAEDLGGHAPGWVVEETRVFADATRFPPLWRRPSEPASPT